MTSNSSMQCAPLLELGAVSCTPPRLCISSWAATSPDQQPASTLAKLGPLLLGLLLKGRSSGDQSPTPQKAVASTNMRYKRSWFLYPRDRSSAFKLPKLLMLDGLVTTSGIIGSQVP